MELAQKHLQNVKTDKDVIDRMKEQYSKTKFYNPYRLKNMYNMQTTGQIMMNLNEKKVVIRMDEEMGEYLGMDNRLPEGYKPKIKIIVDVTD
jgi:quinolinate synthase